MATDEEQRPSKRLRLEDDDTSSRDDDHEQMQGYHSTAKGSRRQSNSASPDPKLDDASEAPPRDAEHLDGNDSRRSEEERDKSVAASLKEGTPTEEKAEDANPKPAARIGQARVQYKQRLILRGHRKGVACVRFSPDGNWIASCSADATIKIWDSVSGKYSQTLEGHLAGISTVAWSPDSKTLASGSDDKSIRLWDVTTGKPHPVPLLGHQNYVYSIAFSPKGNMLVSGSYDEAVFLWDVRSARLMRSLPAHSDPVGGVDFVRDGTLVVSCASDGLIRIWDSATGQCLRTLVHEDNAGVVSVRFSPNGKYVLAWTLDSCVRLWNYVEGRCVKTYQGHKNEKYSISGCFSVHSRHHHHLVHHGKDDEEDGNDEEEEEEEEEEGRKGDEEALVVSGSEDGHLVVWDVKSKNVLQKAKGHDGVILAVDRHPTRDLLVSCGLDRTVRIWTGSGETVGTNGGNGDVKMGNTTSTSTR